MNTLMTELKIVAGQNPDAEGFLIGLTTFDELTDIVLGRICKQSLPVRTSDDGVMVFMGKSVMLSPGMPDGVCLPIYPSSLRVYSKLYAAEFKRRAA